MDAGRGQQLTMPTGDKEWQFPLFRLVLVVTQVATILITWPLWQHRISPPPLPMLLGIPFDFGGLLLLSLAIVLFHAELGVIVHSLTLLLAIQCDQMRLQPEFISQTILLWGTLRRPAARALCRAHLVALWFFAGLHKLFSPEYLAGDAHFLVRSLFPMASPLLVGIVGLGIAVTEMMLALITFLPAWRSVVGWMAFALHSSALLTLSVGLGWDAAVWPWNVALACSGFVMFTGWSTFPLQDVAWRSLPVRVATACLLLLPFGYYPGWVESYLCHLLYSSHVPLAWIHSADGETRLVDTRPELNVPVPQSHRLYEQFFARDGKPGDTLEINDPRLFYRWAGWNNRVIPFEKMSSPNARPLTVDLGR